MRRVDFKKAYDFWYLKMKFPQKRFKKLSKTYKTSLEVYEFYVLQRIKYVHEVVFFKLILNVFFYLENVEKMPDKPDKTSCIPSDAYGL